MICLRLLASSASLCAASVCAAESGSTPSEAAAVSISFDDATAFFEDTDRRPERVNVTAQLEPSSLERVPFRPGEFAMILLRCTNIDPRGKLSGCVATDLEPKGMGYEEVATHVAAALSTDEATARSIFPGLKFVMAEARISNSDVAVTRGPCWPPKCHIIPCSDPTPSKRDADR